MSELNITLADMATEIARLKDAIERQKKAIANIDGARERELVILRKNDDKAQMAIRSLDSEKAMNAELTTELSVAKNWGAELQKELAERDAEIERMKDKLSNAEVAHLLQVDAICKDRQSIEAALRIVRSQKEELTSDNQRLREAVKAAHNEIAAAQLSDEYEPNRAVLMLIEKVTGWDGQNYLQALAATNREPEQEIPTHPCIACEAYKYDGNDVFWGGPHVCETCQKDRVYREKYGITLDQALAATAQGGKEESK